MQKHKWLIQVFKLEDGVRYGRPDVYIAGDQDKVGIFPDLVIDLDQVFGIVLG